MTRRNPDDQVSDGAGAEPAQSSCEGRIVAVRESAVVVEVATPTACDACHTRQSCHVSELGGRQLEVRASGFSVGDRVRITTFAAAVVRASFVLYLIPALLVLVGSFAGYAVAEAFLGIDGNLGSLFGVAAGIGISLVFIHLYKVSTRDGGFEIHLDKIE
jgi:sigma-E factor negative regulatory protein RseC